MTAIGEVTGAETGAVMSFLASKVLGQYDLAPQGVPRLMLVAPNIVQTERELEVDTHDFRLWVAMHEETHRLQFTANPWLRDHMIARTRELTVDIAPTPTNWPAGCRRSPDDCPRPSSRGRRDSPRSSSPRSSGRRSSRSPR